MPLLGTRLDTATHHTHLCNSFDHFPHPIKHISEAVAASSPRSHKPMTRTSGVRIEEGRR